MRPADPPRLDERGIPTFLTVSTVYGPCPGCSAWQVEAPAGTPGKWLEAAMQEHADECEGLDLVRQRLAAHTALIRSGLPLIAATWPTAFAAMVAP